MHRGYDKELKKLQESFRKLEEQSAEEAQQWAEVLKQNINAPVVNAGVSKLGGPENASVVVKGSLDEKDTWANNIFENSRYFMFMIDNGKIELFNKSYKIPVKFRKSRVNSPEQALQKINGWIEAVNSHELGA